MRALTKSYELVRARTQSSYTKIYTELFLRAAQRSYTKSYTELAGAETKTENPTTFYKAVCTSAGDVNFELSCSASVRAHRV